MTDKEISGVERTTLNAVESVRSTLSDNSRILLIGVALVFVLNWAGVISLGLPSWWPIAAVVVGAGVLAGWMASDRIYQLIPETDRIILVSFTVDDGTGGKIWELTPDQFEDIEVENGELYSWDESPKRCYEVRDYDPATNTAVGNWRETKPASDFAESPTVEDVLSEIDELRTLMEPQVQEARQLRRQLPGIIRVLDTKRDMEVNQGLEAATVDADMADATVTSVLNDVLNDDLDPRPHAGGESDDSPDERTNGHAETGAVEIEQDDYDALLDKPAVGDM